MKDRKYFSIVLLAGAIVFIGSRVSSQEHAGHTHGEPQMTAEQMAEMQQWTKLGTPSEHHKHLNYFVGKWATVTKMWMGGPGSPPTESAGTSEIKWMLDGRYLMDTHKGSMMGQPYEGFGITGYDNFRNVYFSSWCSNMQTNMLTMVGSRHPETGVYTYFGEMDEPALNVIGRTIKYVTKVINPNKYVFEIIDLHAGDEYKVIEITYVRK